jgi:hypothetical protein
MRRNGAPIKAQAKRSGWLARLGRRYRQVSLDGGDMIGDIQAMLFSNVHAVVAAAPVKVRTAEVRTAKVRTAEVRTAEVRTAEVRTAEVRTAEAHAVCEPPLRGDGGPQDGSGSVHARLAHHTHWTHAAVVGLHTVCCGAPIVAAIFASGAGLGLLGGLTLAHDVIHEHEVWFVALSATLVLAGGVFEWRVRRTGVRRTPWLFLLSAAAFLVNASVVAMHAGHDHAGHDHAGHDHAVHDHYGRQHSVSTPLVEAVAADGGVTQPAPEAVAAAAPTHTDKRGDDHKHDHSHGYHHHP